MGEKLVGLRGAATETLFQDLRFGLRMLAKSPGLTAVLAITLALGIGANTAIFSVLNGWLFRPLPVPAPEQIVTLGSPPDSRFSYLDLADYRKQADAFSSLFGYDLGIGALTAGGQPHEFAYSSVTGNYFSALGVKPALGRLFLPGEGEQDGSPLVVVLGYAYWRNKLGGDPGIVGKQIRLNGKAATVIGVVQPEFHGVFFAFDMDGYSPLSTIGGSEFWTDRRNRRLMLMGRLKPGVNLARAQSSLSWVAGQLAAQYPQTNKGVEVRVIPENLARPAPLVSSFVPIIAALFLALALLVLLLACVNVANILLARTLAREREMIIRASLGASRLRLIRQMMTESLLIALLGGLTGVVLAEWALTLSGSLLRSVTTTSNFGYRMDVSLDWRVLAYTLAIVIFTAIVAGVWPAWRASRANLNRGFGHQRVRGFLMVAQVAGSLMLMIVTALFARSLARAEHLNLGFDPDHVLTLMLDPQQIGYDESRSKTFYRELEHRVRALPGVQSASTAYSTPMLYPPHAGPVFAEGATLPVNQAPPVIAFNSVDAAYFQTMRVPLLAGRAFRESDGETAPPVAIVNQTLAKKLWPGENPVGRRFSLKSASGPFLQVVGLAADGQYLFLSPTPQAHFYVPLAQSFTPFLSLQVRSTLGADEITAAVREQLRLLAPDLPIIDVRTMQDAVHGLAGLFIFRLAATLAGVLGLLGLTLAVVGVYGVISYSVSRRTREIGIRMALGAGRGDVVKLALVQGLNLVIAGVVVGLLGAWASTRAMTKLLIGVSPSDPVTYAMVAIGLSVVAVLACWVPARRAMSVDPMVALRYE